ncbi:20085_t:CDS:1, partial [Gigaspora rosea]
TSDILHSTNDETDPIEKARILARHSYLDKGIKNIFEMILFCENQYNCRQQLAYRPYLWDDDNDIP